MKPRQLRKLRAAIEASQRYGGYILPFARSVGAEFHDIAWGDFALALSVYGYWGGHAESSVKRAFETGCAGRPVPDANH